MNKRLIYFIYTIIIFFIIPHFDLYAGIIDELKQKILEKNQGIVKLEEEIKEYEMEILETQNEAKTLNNTIKEIDLTRKKLQTDIKITENKIESTNLNINKLEINIIDINSDIENNKLVIAKSLRDLREAESNSLVELVFLNENFSNFWSHINSLELLQEDIKLKLDILKDKGKILSVTKNEEEKHKDNLVNYRGDLSDKKILEDKNKKQKETLLRDTENRESNYQRILKEKKALRDAFEAELNEYESQLKFAIDPSSLPDDGVLGRPLDSIYITQQFGKTVEAQRLYTSGSHNGTDFRASIGTEVKAMHNGVIIGIGDTDLTCSGASFGKWILIDHENGLSSTYAHLSVIRVKEGDIVKRGQIVGLSGNTGYSTGPHLHISLYATKGIGGESGVQVVTRASRVCSGREYTLPVAPINAYLNPIKYINI